MKVGLEENSLYSLWNRVVLLRRQGMGVLDISKKLKVPAPLVLSYFEAMDQQCVKSKRRKGGRLL